MTHVIDPKCIESPGNLNFLLCVEEGIGELFSLSQRALDDLESRDIAQEVADGLVWIASNRVGVRLGLDSGKTWVGSN